MRVYDADRVFDAYEIMASTVCDAYASGAYAEIVANPLIGPAPGRAGGGGQTRTPGTGGWEPCRRTVKSTGKPCSLETGHRGHCRHLAHRKHPPR